MFVSLGKDRGYDQFRKPHKGYAQYKEKVKGQDVLAAHATLLTAIQTFIQNANGDLASSTSSRTV